MITTTCEFSNPIYWSNFYDQLKPLIEGTPVSDPIWNYSSFDCYSENDVFTLIQNLDTGAEFYVEKTLNYGEAIIIWFFSMFFVYLMVKGVWAFFWKK